MPTAGAAPISAVAARPTSQPAMLAVSLRPSCSRRGSSSASSSCKFASECRRPAIASPPRRGVKPVSAEVGPTSMRICTGPAACGDPAAGTSPIRSCWVVAIARSWKPPTSTSDAARALLAARATPAPITIAALRFRLTAALLASLHPAGKCTCFAIMHMRSGTFKHNRRGPSRVSYHPMRELPHNGRGRRELPPPCIRRTTSRERLFRPQ